MKNTVKFLHKILFSVCLILPLFVQAEEFVTYYHNDFSGSPVAATDQAGELLWREEYRPYGEKITNGDLDNRIGYTGHSYDKDTGLTYMQARYYDPVVGRFLGVDPVGVDPQNVFSFNRYIYANDNPYRFFDPDGRETNPVSGTNFIKDSQLRTNASNPNVGKQGNTRSSNNWNNGFHNGVDIAAPTGTSLVAPISGVVRTIDEKNNPKGGNVIFITDKRNASEVKIGMAHLGSISVQNGATVNEGDPIGTSGTTGNAAGLPKAEEHVHLSVRINGKIVDPQTHFKNNPKKTTSKSNP